MYNESLSLWLFYICWYKLRFITFHRTNVYGNLSISFWIILETPRYVIDVWLTIINDRMLLSTHFVLFYAHHRMHYDERVINRCGAHKLCPSFSLLLFHLGMFCFALNSSKLWWVNHWWFLCCGACAINMFSTCEKIQLGNITKGCPQATVMFVIVYLNECPIFIFT